MKSIPNYEENDDNNDQVDEDEERDILQNVIDQLTYNAKMFKHNDQFVTYDQFHELVIKTTNKSIIIMNKYLLYFYNFNRFTILNFANGCHCSID